MAFQIFGKAENLHDQSLNLATNYTVFVVHVEVGVVVLIFEQISILPRLSMYCYLYLPTDIICS